MISYAQNFEDVMLNRVFKAQTTGFYIDIGAADPTNLSVTKWFYDSGWSGINVEPVREFYEKLMRERPRDININCGAGSSSGSARFREFPVKEWSTFDLNAQPSETTSADEISEVVVPIQTLNKIIKENAPRREIDFLKIDVEGWEEQVLLGINLRKHRPTVILIEAIDRITGEQAAEAADKMLHNADYLSVYYDGINKFYVKREREDLAKRFSIPPNVFDNFKLYSEVALEKAIEMQRAEINQAHIELNSRTEQIETLTAMVNKSDAESAARLEQIETLTAMVNKSDAESAARLKQIHALTSNLREREAFIEEFAWFMETKAGRAARPMVRFFSKRAINAKRRPMAK